MLHVQTTEIALHWVLFVLRVIRLPVAVLNGKYLPQGQIMCTTLPGREIDGVAKLGTLVVEPDSLDVIQYALGYLAADYLKLRI